MQASAPGSRDLLLDHVELYVADVTATARWLVAGYGFDVYAAGDPSAPTPVRSVALGRDQIRLVLTEPLIVDHPAAAYLDRHGDGVANIALRVDDVGVAFDRAVRHGARPISPPVAAGGLVTATIMGFGDVQHTFLHRAGDPDERLLPGLTAGARPADVPIPTAPHPSLRAVDHFAVCLEAGTLRATVEFYERALGLRSIFTEQIVVGEQAMFSEVVQSPSGGLTLTLIEPDTSRAPGQIDEFLKNHGGPGVQHIAFSADDIVQAVDAIGAGGVRFLDAPPAYYDLLTQRLTLARHGVAELRRLNVLVDEDHDGQLFQIFSRSVHPRRTLFLEVIERLGARTFGSGNIKALYEAVELQRHREGAAG